MKIGDKVRLKSGSPMMTIEAIKNNDVLCSWSMVWNIVCQEDVFSKNCLEWLGA